MPTTTRAPRVPGRLHLGLAVAAYVALGVTWILVSDAIVAAISTDPAWLATAQRYKGFFYVAATALGLWLVVHAGYRDVARAVAQAQSHELQVQDLFQRHPQPMWVHDAASGAILRVNAAALRRYGHDEATFLSLKVDDIRLGGVAAVADPGGLPASLDGGPPPERHRTRQGEVFYARVTANDVQVDGRAARMVMAIDNTAEVLAQRALQRQESQFRQLHQSLGEVLWLTQANGRDLLYVSPAFDTVYGRPVADFHRDPGLWLGMVHPDDRAAARASARQLRQQGHSSVEYRICRPDGSVRWISDRKSFVLDDEGQLSRIGGIAEDITAIKERDAARAVTQAELERRVAERTADLERVNAELDAFTRTAAHDLKSPLNAVAGYSALLRHTHGPALGDKGVELLQRIEQSAREMAALVNDLLTLSRVTSTELHLADVDLAALARELVAELRAQEPDRQVLFDAPPQLVMRCDAGLARSLLANLLCNAWKFTGTRPQAHIRLLRHGGDAGVQAVVEDDGVGFDASHLGVAFKPFQRFHKATEFAGNGVGLVTCQRIVARHGGALRIDSTPGQGTVVRFSLADAAALPASAPAPATDR